MKAADPALAFGTVIGEALAPHVVWVAAKRRLYRDVWTLRAGAPPAAGDPVTMGTGDQQHVFYRGEDGGIHHILWSPLSPAHAVPRRLARQGRSARGGW